LLTVVLLLVVGYLSHSRIDFLRWAGGKSLVINLVLGVAWGLVQQYVLQAFINRRAMIVFGRGWASILLVATIFAGLHLPNLWLAVITFVGGTIWALVYQRAPNLFALAISHSVMTWVVVSTVPPNALRHLRLGLRYFL
jgi:membrane protease YdiL (CAAX protease family)